MNRRIALLMVLSLMAALSRSQDVRAVRDGTSTIFGYVLDEYDGFNLQGAWVWVDGTNLSASTDSWGHYEIAGVQVVSLSADFTADVVSGPFPLTVQFHGFTEGGSPVVKVTHPGYLDWRKDQISLVTNGFTNVSADLHPKYKMRVSAEWNYYQYMNPVTAYLKTPSIGGQEFLINSSNPEGSLGEQPYALFQKRDAGEGKLIYLTFAEFSNGTYRYYLFVDKFGIGWGYDVPTIRIYDENGLINTINAYVIGEGNYWHVCDIDGSDGSITLIDQWLTSPPPSKDGPGRLPEKQIASEKATQSSRSRAFSWNFGDGGMSTEQNPVHTYNTTGTFTVSLSVSDGVSEVVKTKENFIGVGASRIPDQEIIALSLRPNPAREEIHIDWPVNESGFRHGAEWEILDSHGRKVMSGHIASHPSRDLRIDISNLPSGVYIIRITGDDGVSGCCRFIAQ